MVFQVFSNKDQNLSRKTPIDPLFVLLRRLLFKSQSKLLGDPPTLDLLKIP